MAGHEGAHRRLELLRERGRDVIGVAPQEHVTDDDRTGTVGADEVVQALERGASSDGGLALSLIEFTADGHGSGRDTDRHVARVGFQAGDRVRSHERRISQDGGRRLGGQRLERRGQPALPFGQGQVIRQPFPVLVDDVVGPSGTGQDDHVRRVFGEPGQGQPSPGRTRGPRSDLLPSEVDRRRGAGCLGEGRDLPALLETRFDEGRQPLQGV
ncbi:MAG TPA: hypothetical protein VJZ50_09975 [Candidatus Limnocylindrales bacterium]|nr:hypothetical protein [Candidatus Limnocylindrales bacterium]